VTTLFSFVVTQAIRKVSKVKTQSLMQIEDFYIQRRFTGEKLRKALKADKEYQKLLKVRRKTLGAQLGATTADRKKYVLSTDKDFEILTTCKQLQKHKLNNTEKKLVKLIKSQLEDDWRKPLIQELNLLLRKYQK
jgi:bifunctional DNA-binding transcriptional regulator/antitoxin component of YhaV-PrlF toxin-antitoxin module